MFTPSTSVNVTWSGQVLQVPPKPLLPPEVHAVAHRRTGDLTLA
jgi:hypothetical protein